MLDAATTSALASYNPSDHHGCYCNRAGWIVAATHPQAEVWAQRNLTQRGYVTYLPLHPVRRRDRVLPSLAHTVSRPMFAGYVFLQFDSRDSWRPIYETPGVRTVIRCGNQIQWVSEDALEAVRGAEQSAASQTQDAAQWAPGALVAPAIGIFAGLPAIVLSTHRDTARIGLMFLGHLCTVSVPLDCLKARDETL